MSEFKVGDEVRTIPILGGECVRYARCGFNCTVIEAMAVSETTRYIVQFDKGDSLCVGEDELRLQKKVDKDYAPSKEPTKYNSGKPLMNLVRPEFVKGVAEALTYGATKYDEKRGDTPNYLKGEGFHYTTLLDSLERHLNSFKSGVDIDEESGIHHLLLAATNIMFLHTYEVSDKGVDDREVLNEKK
mgnify:CR=1 FL=1